MAKPKIVSCIPFTTMLFSKAIFEIRSIKLLHVATIAFAFAADDDEADCAVAFGFLLQPLSLSLLILLFASVDDNDDGALTTARPSANNATTRSFRPSLYFDFVDNISLNP